MPIYPAGSDQFNLLLGRASNWTWTSRSSGSPTTWGTLNTTSIFVYMSQPENNSSKRVDEKMSDIARRGLLQKSLAFVLCIGQALHCYSLYRRWTRNQVLMHDDARMELDGVFIFQPTNWPGVFFFFWFGNFYEEQESNVQYIRTFRCPNHMILIISPDPI